MNAAALPLSRRLVGRTFLHPALDYLLVGGGASLVVLAAILYTGLTVESVDDLGLAVILLASNSAHFASSTVRLYSKPGAFSTWPFLTMSFPLVALAVLATCIAWAGTLGPPLQSLYLTWSPFHYAAQAYGLAVVYTLRSGCKLSRLDKRLLWWAAMLPFFVAFFSTAKQTGIGWLLPEGTLERIPALVRGLRMARTVLVVAAFAAPVAIYARLWRAPGGPMPLIGPLLLATNAVWWCVLPPRGAFVWATVFHGLQYLVIVVVFHVKERLGRPDNQSSWLAHTVRFYGVSLLLAYALFSVLPRGFVLAGFGMVESLILVIAAINIHHFVVDGFIWRLKPADSNRRVVEEGNTQPALG